MYIYGKDTTHTDFTSGQVTQLKGAHVTQVAVGKAHIVALTKKGEVFTFGVNNKGQCGRDFPSHSKEDGPSGAAAEATGDDGTSDNEAEQGGLNSSLESVEPLSRFSFILRNLFHLLQRQT